MPVDQSLREGKLDDSLAELQEKVRKDPSNTKHRIFLFQLLAILGQWERAMTQLKVLGEMDAADGRRNAGDGADVPGGLEV